MTYTINEFKQKVFQDVFKVYEIFKDFFGEDYVDLQGIPPDEYLLPNGVSMEDFPNTDISEDYLEAMRSAQAYFKIFVWWPNVTITNELNRSVDIQDLYARVTVDINGHIPYEHTFNLCRSTFSEVQFASGYIHSHLPGFDPDRYRDQLVFQNPCLGRGPINHTIMNLHNNNEETLWMLFCQELSVYVTVESLTGVPYRKLEEIGNLRHLHTFVFQNNVESGNLDLPSDLDSDNLIIDFTKYYLSHGHLKLSFLNGEYKCGYRFFNFIIDISNSFIEWANQYCCKDDIDELFGAKTIMKVIVKDKNFYNSASLHVHNIEEIERFKVLRFKNQDIHLRILQSNSSESQTTIVLDPNLANYILNQILKIINYHYNEYNNTIGTGSEGSSSSANQTILYL